MAFHLLMPLGSETSHVLHWAALLLTYCGHAFTWTLVATLLARRRALSGSIKTLVWRLALLGPITTSVLSAALPLGSVWILENTGSQLVAAPALEKGAAIVSNAAREINGASATREPAAWSARGSLESRVLAALLVAALLLGLVRFGRSGRLLLRVLRGRTTVRDARLYARFERLRVRAGLPHARLTESKHIAGPLVVGRREICIPNDLTSYSDGEIDAILAHELAHLESHDGLWFPVVGLIESVFWMQPFNHWVSARYRQSAELACDERAVELTGAPMDLARALTRMAEAALPSRGHNLLPAMAGYASARLERVQRLVDTSNARGSAPSAQRARRRDRCMFLVCAMALGIANPSFSVQTARALPSRNETDPAVQTITAPDAAGYADAMSALATQQRQLEAQLAALPDHAGNNPSNAVELLELRQALRHVQATQAWTETQFERDWEAWERAGARAQAHAAKTPP
jgi:beta-lactamase regulating signal transducer with metallopeptidase domain